MSNVRYDDGVVTALRDAGRTVVEFDAEESVEPAVAAALADDPGADVLYHTGAMGIEPVVYLLGDDAVAVADGARNPVTDAQSSTAVGAGVRPGATAPGAASWRDRTVDSLALAPGNTVVEMGCGTGANVPALRERVGPSGQVVGIDVTREMLDRARERPARSGGAVHYVQADAARPPIREADAVRRRSSPASSRTLRRRWTRGVTASALAAASPC